MASEFKIGTTLEGITALADLTTPLPDPQWEYFPYSKLVSLGDGSARGLGMAKVIWKFPLLEVEQIDELRTLCPEASGEIYFRSKIYDDTFVSFAGTVVWPVAKDGSHKFNGVRAELTLEFRNLVEQEEGS